MVRAVRHGRSWLQEMVRRRSDHEEMVVLGFFGRASWPIWALNGPASDLGSPPEIDP